MKKKRGEKQSKKERRKPPHRDLLRPVSRIPLTTCSTPARTRAWGAAAAERSSAEHDESAHRLNVVERRRQGRRIRSETMTIQQQHRRLAPKTTDLQSESLTQKPWIGARLRFAAVLLLLSFATLPPAFGWGPSASARHLVAPDRPGRPRGASPRSGSRLQVQKGEAAGPSGMRMKKRTQRQRRRRRRRRTKKQQRKKRRRRRRRARKAHGISLA